MPNDGLCLFHQNLAYARDMMGTALARSAQLTSAIDTDDLLRAALVQAVSAFDHFIHEEVRARMILTQSGAHPRARGFDSFKVPLIVVDDALAGGGTQWLEDQIRTQHGYLSFQQPDKVADAIRLVSDVHLWQQVGLELGKPASEIKLELKLIVDRRNQIAHEADTDPTPPHTRYAIDGATVKGALDFIEAVVKAIITVT